MNPPRKTPTTRTARPGRRDAAGFTLLELLAIVAATGIMGALGVSAYRTYAVRVAIAGAIATTRDVRDRVEAAFRATGIPPTDRSAAGIAAGRNPAWGQDAQDVDVVNGRVEIRFGPTADEAIAGRTLSITPFETADQRVVWLCGNKLPGVGLVPLGFAGGATQPVQLLTRIEPRYLPPDCR